MWQKMYIPLENQSMLKIHQDFCEQRLFFQKHKMSSSKEKKKKMLSKFLKIRKSQILSFPPALH